MPMINVRYSTPRDGTDLREQIATRIAAISTRTLSKAPDVTAVLAEPADASGWFVGGKSLSQTGLAAFWLQIVITSGTNVRSETIAFVREAFEGMRDILGPLDEHSYVHVHAAEGDRYGYGGETQSARFAPLRLKSAA